MKIQKYVISQGVSCFFKTGDIASTELANEIVQDALYEMSTINLLVANAGMGRFKNIEDITDDDFDLSFSTNVRGVFVYLRPIIRHMKQNNHGQVIVTSSSLGFNTTARGSIYCATKYALQGMVGSIRKELVKSQVKIATINPGGIDTPWFVDYGDDPITHRLDVQEVVDSIMLIINQGERSDIDHILLKPTFERPN